MCDDRVRILVAVRRNVLCSAPGISEKLNIFVIFFSTQGSGVLNGWGNIFGTGLLEGKKMWLGKRRAGGNHGNILPCVIVIMCELISD